MIASPSAPTATSGSTPTSPAGDTGPDRKRALDARLAGLSLRSQRLLKAARDALERKQAAVADEALERVRANGGGHPEYLRLLGITRLLQKRRSDAVAALRLAAERKPSDPLILTNLGSALRAAGQFTEARAALHRACELAPDLAAGWYNLGQALAADGRLDEAADAYERALGSDPDYVQARMGYAELFRKMKNFTRAATEYRRVIKHSPQRVRAWERLAALKSVKLTDKEIAALEQLHARPDLAAEDRIRVGFTLGHVLDRKKRYAEAFTVLSAANAAKRRLVRWDPQAFSRNVNATIKAFEQPPRSDAEAGTGSDIVFVVGLPHAGSATAARILSAHGEVGGTTELSDLSIILDEESRRLGDIDFPAWAPKASAADWRRLGRDYIQRTERWRRSSSWLIDTSLQNWRFVGAIVAMLPGARIINCRRDPLETCLACYHAQFVRGRNFSYDIPELGSYWRDHDRLVRFWLARYPHRLLDHSLEDLIADPESGIRRLLAFCDLPFDPACVRSVASSTNVRAINARQSNLRMRAPRTRASDYAPTLLPLRAVLGADMQPWIAKLRDARR